MTTADSLNDNHVQHVELLADGRMQIVSTRTINLYDGGDVVCIPRTENCIMPLPHHRYLYHDRR